MKIIASFFAVVVFTLAVCRGSDPAFDKTGRGLETVGRKIEGTSR